MPQQTLREQTLSGQRGLYIQSFRTMLFRAVALALTVAAVSANIQVHYASWNSERCWSWLWLAVVGCPRATWVGSPLSLCQDSQPCHSATPRWGADETAVCVLSLSSPPIQNYASNANMKRAAAGVTSAGKDVVRSHCVLRRPRGDSSLCSLVRWSPRL